MDNEYLVKLITEQVMNILSQKSAADSPPTDGLQRILVIGDISRLPEDSQSSSVVLGLDDYKNCRDITRYDSVVITQLSFADLADIAMGRDSRTASCAVVNALLYGVDVLIYDDALPHRHLISKGSTALYATIEGYVQTLQVYGVKMVSKEQVNYAEKAKPPKLETSAPSENTPQSSDNIVIDRLITEAMAYELSKNGKTITIASGTLLTPSAKDVFSRAKIEVIQEQQEV